MPACFARRAHARASKSVGLNSSKNGVYCASGISSTERTHSPRAGIAYSPQWMNMPNRSCRNHFIRSSYFARSNLYILIDPFACALQRQAHAQDAVRSACAPSVLNNFSILRQLCKYRIPFFVNSGHKKPAGRSEERPAGPVLISGRSHQKTPLVRSST